MVITLQNVQINYDLIISVDDNGFVQVKIKCRACMPPNRKMWNWKFHIFKPRNSNARYNKLTVVRLISLSFLRRG